MRIGVSEDREELEIDVAEMLTRAQASPEIAGKLREVLLVQLDAGLYNENDAVIVRDIVENLREGLN